MMLATTKMKNDLNAPLVVDFDNLKEEAAKFLVIWYHAWKNGWMSLLRSHQNSAISLLACQLRETMFQLV